jgi:hypothetical protein
MNNKMSNSFIAVLPCFVLFLFIVEKGIIPLNVAIVILFTIALPSCILIHYFYNNVKILYQCSICHEAHTSKEECKKCEKSHGDFEDLGAIPKEITVCIRGKKVSYVIRGVEE